MTERNPSSARGMLLDAKTAVKPPAEAKV